jgi:hypothetical protein
MTTIDLENLTCGACGSTSLQTLMRSTSSFGPGDLDGRPGEPKRSALQFMVLSCPTCGFVARPGEFDSSIDDRLKTLVQSAEYEHPQPDVGDDVARSFIRLAMIDDAQGRSEYAAWGLLYAAWALDDAGERQGAASCRRSALARWAGAAGEPSGEWGYRLVSAETARRAGRFDAALDVACDAVVDLADEQGRGLLGVAAFAAASRSTLPISVADADAGRLPDGDDSGEATSRVIACAIGALRRRLRREQPAGAAVFESTGGYVQVLVDADSSEIHGEAADLEAQEIRSLEPWQREVLGELGWRDPKGQPGDHETLNFVQTWTADEGVEAAALALATTMRRVYGASPDAPLALHLMTYDEEARGV